MTPRAGKEVKNAVYPARDFPASPWTEYMLGDEDRRRKPMAVEVQESVSRRRFTRHEFHRMAEAGIFKPGERVELIRGEIIQMFSIGRRHVAFVNNLNQLLVTRLAGRGVVSVQNPVVLFEDSEPQPDLAVLRPRTNPAYKELEPGAADVLLLIEVAESSLRYDRTTKLRLYAEAGIPEYWVVNCEAESIETYRTPTAAGYGDVTQLARTGTIALGAVPEVALTLAEVFA
jgi:Uma2 family endonuclease